MHTTNSIFTLYLQSLKSIPRNYLRSSQTRNMFLITVMFLVLCLSENCEPKTSTRVLHGRDAKNEEFPFVVCLGWKMKIGNEFKRFCTGTVIAENWVLSAGHCVFKMDLENLYIIHTNFTVSSAVSKLYSKVRFYFIHPPYRRGRIDVSLLLVDKLGINSIARLSAVDHITMVGLPVTYVGGGMTNKSGDDQLRPLQVGEAGIVRCNDIRVQAYAICLVSVCGKKDHSPWFGDSGGPLLYEGQIIGVCSGKVRTQDVYRYSAVSPHMDWIFRVMQTNN